MENEILRDQKRNHVLIFINKFKFLQVTTFSFDRIIHIAYTQLDAEVLSIWPGHGFSMEKKV